MHSSFPIGKLEEQLLMTHKLSHIEYLIPTDNILMVLLHSNLIVKSSPVDRFSIWFYNNSEVAYFSFGHPVKGGPKTDTQCYFWDNFGNSAPILTILSLLQAEIYGA